MKNIIYACLILVYACSPNNPLNDKDGDKIIDEIDNCPFIANEDQSDIDNDGIGDECDDYNGPIISTSIQSNFVFDNYNYPIDIYLPESYNTNKTLPIIYVLDGKLNSKTVANILKDINADAIVVGVGDFAAYNKWTRRWIDLLPGTKCHGTGGNHLDFYKFITKELIPYIDSQYDNDHSSRSFMGHSSAGIFTLVSMFLEDTDNIVFQNFVASDPELGCDLNYFIEMLHDNTISDGAKKIKLYLALSGEGDITAVDNFATIIQESNYTWLDFRYQKYMDKGHMSVIDPSFSSSLKFIFNK